MNLLGFFISPATMLRLVHPPNAYIPLYKPTAILPTLVSVPSNPVSKYWVLPAWMKNEKTLGSTPTKISKTWDLIVFTFWKLHFTFSQFNYPSNDYNAQSDNFSDCKDDLYSCSQNNTSSVNEKQKYCNMSLQAGSTIQYWIYLTFSLFCACNTSDARIRSIWWRCAKSKNRGISITTKWFTG